MTTRGIFILENVRSRQREGEWVPVDNIWVTPSVADNGYIGPGYVWPSNPLTSVSKITYGTDSIATIPSGNFPDSKRNAATFSSLTAGYITAGIGAPAPGHPSGKRDKYTYKFTYATETTARALPAPVTNHPGGSGGLGNNGMGGVSNTEVAYTNTSDQHGTSSSDYSRLYKFTFATESWNFPGYFNEAWYYSGQGFGNQTHAYWAGGIPGIRSNVRRVEYSTDTMAYPPNLAATRAVTSASSDADAAYIFYGQSVTPSPSATPISTIIKLTYSTETSSILPSYMNDSAKSNTSATGNLSNGYVTGKGYTTPASDGNSSVSKFNYSTGTASNVGSNPQGAMISVPMWSARMYAHPGKYAAERFVDGQSSFSNAPNKGYWLGGWSPSVSGTYTSFSKIDMSTDTISEVTDRAPATKRAYASGNTEATWFSGGNRSRLYKFTYSTETDANSPAILGTSGDVARAATGTREVAYYGGGFPSVPANWPGYTRTLKVTYSTENVETLPSANNITPERGRMSAVGNQTVGHWVGGKDGPSPSNNTSLTVKMTYSTETMSAGNPFPYEKSDIGATSNSTHGYFRGGGPSSISQAFKLPFANETWASAPSINLPYSLYANSATGNDDSGYWAGGWYSNNARSFTSKVDFATDTKYTTGSINLNSLFGGNSGASARMRGNVIQPGSPDGPPAPTPTPNTSAVTTDFGLRSSGGTVIDKLDFTTDTTSVGLETPSDVPETGGHDGEGWYDQTGGRMVFGTGGASGPINQIKMGTLTGSRIPSLSPVAVLPNVTIGYEKVWNYSATEGWYQGGIDGPANNHYTTATRLTFATDTLQDQTYGRLANGISRAVGLSNPTHKYAVGGRTSPSSANDRSFVQKGSFTSGNFSITPSANLNAKTSDHGGTGNETEGYIAGRDASPSNGASPESRFQKLTYSNDTTSTLPGSTLGISVPDCGRGLSGTGNQTTGYFGGGDYMGPLNGNNFPIVKLVYATGTPSAIPSWVTSSNTRGALQQSSGEQNGNGTSPVPNIM